MDVIVEALKKVSLFGEVPEDALADLSEKVETFSLPADTVLFKAGDMGDDLYMIVKGKVCIFGQDEQGHEVQFSELKEGDYFGEMSLLDKKPRSASARTLTACELLKLSQANFISVLDRHPTLAVKIASEISSRFRASVQLLDHLQVLEDKFPGVQRDDGERVRVFISYSRRNKEFVLKLHEGLVANGFETWVDWEDIPLGTDWWREIEEAIQQSDIFLAVLSRDSVASKYCADEIQVAIENNKRLIPVLLEEEGMIDRLRAELRAINFTYMRTDEEFQAMLPNLVATLNTDLDYVKTHTRLHNLSLEWERKHRSPSLMLRGEELESAENWLAHAGGKYPPPSSLQGELIHASRKDALRRQRLFMTGVVAALIVVLVLAVFSAFSYAQAEQSRRIAVTSQAEALAARDEAERNEALAESQRATAEAASTLAIEQQQIADERARAASTAEAQALEQKERADRERGRAEFQREIAEAQRLASQAEGDLPRGNLLTRSILLAITSMQISRNYQADQVIRSGLDILPSMLFQKELESGVVGMAYSPDGNLLAIAQENGVVEVWDSLFGNVLATLVHEGAITDMDFSVNSAFLAVAGEDGSVWVWDPVTGEEIYRLRHEGAVRTLVFSPNGFWLGAGGDDGIARVWNLRTGRMVASVFHLGAVLDMDFSPGGSWVISGGTDRAVKVWAPTTGEVFQTLYHETAVEHVRFSPNANWLAAATRGGTVTVWNPSNGGRVSRLSHEQDVAGMAFSPEGDWLVTASLDHTARVWNPFTGQALAQMRHDQAVVAVIVSPTGQWIATASEDDTARVWDAQSGREIARMEHWDDVTALAFSPNGLVLTTGSRDRSVRVWSPEEAGQAVVRLKHPGAVLELDFSPDETLVATAGADRVLRLWNVANEDEPQVQLEIRVSSPLQDVEFSSDGQFITAGTADGVAWIWEAATGVEVRRFVHGGAVLDVDFANEGRWLVTGSADGLARLWLVESGEVLGEFQLGGAVGEVDVDPQGGRLAAASLDGSARVWGLETGEEGLQLEHPAGVFLVSFIPQRNWIVTASRDNTIRFWEATTGELLHRFFVDGDIQAIEVSADGARLVVTGTDSLARVWEISVEEEALSLVEVSRVIHLDVINDVRFVLGGERLATASEDSLVLISLLTPEELVAKACGRLTRNFTQKEWIQFFGDEIYSLTCENRPPDPEAVRALEQKVGEYGAAGDYQAALDLMRHIQTLDSAREIDVAEEVQRLTMQVLLGEGATLAAEGDFEGALARLRRLETFEEAQTSPGYGEFLSNLCKAGANAEYAATALEICDAAVAFAPENGLAHDHRGRVRAWLGDFAGAIEDFEFFIAWLEGEPSVSEDQKPLLIQERQGWIEALRSEANPFAEPEALPG